MMQDQNEALSITLPIIFHRHEMTACGNMWANESEHTKKIKLNAMHSVTLTMHSGLHWLTRDSLFLSPSQLILLFRGVGGLVWRMHSVCVPVRVNLILCGACCVYGGSEWLLLKRRLLCTRHIDNRCIQSAAIVICCRYHIESTIIAGNERRPWRWRYRFCRRLNITIHFQILYLCLYIYIYFILCHSITQILIHVFCCCCFLI